MHTESRYRPQQDIGSVIRGQGMQLRDGVMQPKPYNIGICDSRLRLHELHSDNLPFANFAWGYLGMYRKAVTWRWPLDLGGVGDLHVQGVSTRTTASWIVELVKEAPSK